MISGVFGFVLGANFSNPLIRTIMIHDLWFSVDGILRCLLWIDGCAVLRPDTKLEANHQSSKGVDKTSWQCDHFFFHRHPTNRWQLRTRWWVYNGPHHQHPYPSIGERGEVGTETKCCSHVVLSDCCLNVVRLILIGILPGLWSEVMSVVCIFDMPAHWKYLPSVWSDGVNTTKLKDD